MKKILSIVLTAAMLISMVSMMAIGVSAAPAEGYYVGITEQTGLEFGTKGSDKAALVLDGVTAAADAAYPATAFYNGWFAVGIAVKSYKLYVNGVEKPDYISYTFCKAPSVSAGSEYTTEESLGTATYNINISLPEGTYAEVTVDAIDKEGNAYHAFKYTNITVTAPTRTVSEEGIPVDNTPCWVMDSNALAGSTGSNQVSMVNNGFYTTYQCTEVGDPYISYLGAPTKTGRFLLIKYNNHTEIPRMQIYMAQEAGIQSDSNMIEFEISANQSGWTYVVVDLAQNKFYNKDTMSLVNFRFDPLEARNYFGMDYQFTGDETIDVAYIMGFTTSQGLKNYLDANELHAVTKTATVKESELSSVEKLIYTDKNGVDHTVTKNEDGTYSYTFNTTDVRVPCDTTPNLLLDGSHLVGDTYNSCEVTYDTATGVANLKCTGADPNYWVINKNATKIGRFMAIKYKTTVSSQMQFFLSSSDAGPAGGQEFTKDYINDGEWHTMLIDLSTCGVSTLNTETYEINFLRMDFFTGATEGEMQVEYIAFFDSEDAAFQYVHAYKTYTITFKADGKVVETIVFEHGTTSIKEPTVPPKEGYTAAWATYTMSDSNITVNAKYTKIEVPTEPATKPAATEPAATEPAATEPATNGTTTPAATGDTATEAVTETATKPATTNGCGSVVAVSAVGVLAVIALAGINFKKKEN